MTRALFFLPNISHYQDRAKLLMEVSNGLDHLTLMVGRLDADVDPTPYPRLNLVEVGFRRRLRPLNVRRASRLAERLIDDEGLNIVHDTFGTLLPLFKKKAHYPNVSFVTSLYILAGWRLKHVWNHLNALQRLRYKKGLLMQHWSERRICRAADRIVLQAPGLVDRLLEDVSLPRDRIAVLRNSVDAAYWTPHPSSHKPSTGRRGCNILFVGGIDHTKGVFAMIEVMKRLKERGDRSRLTVVGSWGEYERREAMRQIEQHDLGMSIEFVSFADRDRIRDFYRSSDLFLYQTTNDASPRVVLEALACGLPVIASHHPGIDIIDPQEEFISFTDFGDAAQIVRYVEDFQAHPEDWRRKSRSGRESVAENFDTAAAAPAYLDYYRSLTGQRQVEAVPGGRA